MKPLMLAAALGVGLASPSVFQSWSVGAPTLAVDIQGSRFGGGPAQLTWSPDSTTLCLKTLDGDKSQMARYYELVPAEHTFRGVDFAPEWAAKYWTWKSARSAPGHPELVIQVENRNRSGGIPTEDLHAKGNNVSGGRTDTTLGINSGVAAANEAQGSVVRTLLLDGHAIGQYVDEPLVPGTTFGWSPETLHAVAFASPNGHLQVWAIRGETEEAPGAKGVLLPAWSPDGSQIAYLQKIGRNHYALMQVAVARR
jgi:hypothetical protein